jgi:predicted DNA-binding transcriptional regulator AlpA
MSEVQVLRTQMEILTKAFTVMAGMMGSRLTRHQMCERLGISGKTLTHRVRQGEVPTPGADGKWLLAEVVQWESAKAASQV